MKRSLPILAVVGVGLVALAVLWLRSDAPESVPTSSRPMPEVRDREVPELADASAPQVVGADETAPPVAPATGGVRGRILSRDPRLSPPYHLTWKHEGESPASALRCDGEAFELASLLAGEWLLEVRSWSEDLDLPRRELLGGPAPEPGRVLAQRTLRIEAGKILELEVWVGRDSAESAHLLGFLEGPNVDLRSEYRVHLSIVEEDGGRFETRSAVDDSLAFDFGFVPPGQAGYELQVVDPDNDVSEHLLAIGSVLLVAGKQTVLPIAVPETTRIRFRILGGGGSAETRIHWFSRGTTEHGGMVLYPHKSEISVPAGEYLAIAYQDGFAAELARIEARGPEIEVALRLSETSQRRVQLVDSAGNVLPGAVLRVVRIDDTDLGQQLALNTMTNTDGMFDASALPAGRLEVEIYLRDGSTHRVVVDRSTLGDRLSVE